MNGQAMFDRIKSYSPKKELNLLLIAVSSGLYPLIFYISDNYFQINSWQFVAYLLAVFLLAPLVVIPFVGLLLKRFQLKGIKYLLLTVLNLGCFFFLIHLCLYGGLRWPIALVAGILAILLGFLLYRHLRKLILIQLLLALVGFFYLVVPIIKDFRYSKEWQQQPDDIEQAIFRKKPNIYFIQPDGYPALSDLSGGYYKQDVSGIKDFLLSEGFTIYDPFRSNYVSTITSNSATFAMKHHYYNDDTNFGESINLAGVIVEDNSLLRLLRHNGYTTYFLTERPYLLDKGSEFGFDYNNFQNSNRLTLGDGLNKRRDATVDFVGILEKRETPSFIFMQLFKPWHVPVKKSKSAGMEAERELWLERLQVANKELKATIEVIKEQDPEALIIVMADHGGYVGFDYMLQLHEKTGDADKIRSMFGVLMAVHWPDDRGALYDGSLKSSVNLFRVVTSYLAEDVSYLENLQSDKGFAPIKSGAEKGIYCYIDEHGKITFRKRKNE